MNPDAILEPEKLIVDAIDGAKEVPDPLAGLLRYAREYGDMARFCVMTQERILLL